MQLDNVHGCLHAFVSSRARSLHHCKTSAIHQAANLSVQPNVV